MSIDEENEWSDFLREIKNNVREHAGYFSWESNRAIEEAGVVQCLSESLERKGELFFITINHDRKIHQIVKRKI